MSGNPPPEHFDFGDLRYTVYTERFDYSQPAPLPTVLPSSSSGQSLIRSLQRIQKTKQMMGTHGETSNLREDALNDILRTYHMNREALAAQLPDLTYKYATTPPPLFCTVYQGHLECGLRFPVCPPILSILNWFNIGLPQLVPNGIRFITGFAVYCRLLKIKFTVALFRHFFSCAQNNKDASIYYFKNKGDFHAMLGPGKKSWKGWKNKFFFVQTNGVDRLRRWNTGDIGGGPFEETDERSLAIIKAANIILMGETWSDALIKAAKLENAGPDPYVPLSDEEHEQLTSIADLESLDGDDEILPTQVAEGDAGGVLPDPLVMPVPATREMELDEEETEEDNLPLRPRNRSFGRLIPTEVVGSLADQTDDAIIHPSTTIDEAAHVPSSGDASTLEKRKRSHSRSSDHSKKKLKSKKSSDSDVDFRDSKVMAAFEDNNLLEEGRAALLKNVCFMKEIMKRYEKAVPAAEKCRDAEGMVAGLQSEIKSWMKKATDLESEHTKLLNSTQTLEAEKNSLQDILVQERNQFDQEKEQFRTFKEEQMKVMNELQDAMRVMRESTDAAKQAVQDANAKVEQARVEAVQQIEQARVEAVRQYKSGPAIEDLKILLNPVLKQGFTRGVDQAKSAGLDISTLPNKNLYQQGMEKAYTDRVSDYIQGIDIVKKYGPRPRAQVPAPVVSSHTLAASEQKEKDANAPSLADQ